MDSFLDFLNKMQNKFNKVENIINEEMDDKSTKCVTSIQAVTRVKTGNLRRSMGKDDIIKEGDSYSIKIGADLNQAPYAPIIEDGGVTSKGNMRIGDHMISGNIDIYQKELEESIQDRIEREVFNN